MAVYPDVGCAVKFFIAVVVFFELVHFIATSIHLIEGDYPRHQIIPRTFDIAGALVGAALAYWGLTLLSP
jgi:hypothetical protein